MARALRRPSKLVAAYVLIAVFGNVSNFSIPIIRFPSVVTLTPVLAFV